MEALINDTFHNKLLKTQHGRIPIDPAILAAIGQCFIAKKKKTKNGNWQVWDQKPDTFFFYTFFFI